LTILLNKKQLDFTLENEKYLGEVINGIEQWLKDSNLIITSLAIGERELLEEEKEEWKDIPLTDIESVSITVKPSREIHLTAMENICHFLSMLKKAIAETDKKLFSELLTGYPYMVESLKLIFSAHPDTITPSIQSFTALFTGLKEDQFLSWSPEQKEKVLDILSTIHTYTDALILESRDPLEALHKTGEQLKTSIKEISEVSILLQTGKDKKAMDVCITFSTVFQNFVRIFLQVKNRNIMSFNGINIAGTTLEAYYNELNGFLRELSEAFTINDSVLIGDLLEYEIAPRLEELIHFIEILQESDTLKNGKYDA
jgi:hypothetical protein